MLDFFYTIFKDDLNTITFYSINEFIETCKESANYVEYLPTSVQNDLYVDSYYSTYNLNDINGFRNYWQYRLFIRSLINFNYNWLWSFIHIDESYWTSWRMYDNFLGFHDPNNELLFKMKRFRLTRKSIWDNILVSERSIKHYVYAVDHLLTSNFYIQNLSGKKYKSGFFFQYYEHFYSIEIFFQFGLTYVYDFTILAAQNQLLEKQLWFNFFDLRGLGSHIEYFRTFKNYDKIDYVQFNNWDNFEGFRLIKNVKKLATRERF